MRSHQPGFFLLDSWIGFHTHPYLTPRGAGGGGSGFSTHQRFLPPSTGIPYHHHKSLGRGEGGGSKMPRMPGLDDPGRKRERETDGRTRRRGERVGRARRVRRVGRAGRAGRIGWNRDKTRVVSFRGVQCCAVVTAAFTSPLHALVWVCVCIYQHQVCQCGPLCVSVYVCVWARAPGCVHVWCGASCCVYFRCVHKVADVA